MNISKPPSIKPPVPPFEPKHLVHHPKRGAASRFFRNINGNTLKKQWMINLIYYTIVGVNLF